MRKFVVTTKSRRSGKKDIRLIPAKDERTARERCNTETDEVVSCESYHGQKTVLDRPEPIYRLSGLFTR